MKRVLIVSQAITQGYVDTIIHALGQDVYIDIITGSNISGNIIHSPMHDPRSVKSRFVCWHKHYAFIMNWMKKNSNKHYDLIFAVSNPPINPIIGVKLKKVFKAPFVYMNWDLYPQVIELSMNIPLAKLVCRVWSFFNNIIYAKIDKMITIGEVMAHSLTDGLKNNIPVTVIPLSVDTQKLKPILKDQNVFVNENNLNNKFIVLYSGKMGVGHNIEIILEAAERLRNFEDIQFVFIGNGSKYSLVENYLLEHKNTNISLFPLQPDDMFPYSMACGDIGIVSQEAAMAHLFMPSKTYSMMACGEAIIGVCTDHDDLFHLINQYEIGIGVTDESAETLANAIRNLYENRELLEIMKKNARDTAVNRYSVQVIENNYKKLFDEVME